MGGYHLGDMPTEVLNYILKWVVSSELDMRWGQGHRGGTTGGTVKKQEWKENENEGRKGMRMRSTSTTE